VSAPKKIDAWWFSASDCLPHGDGRLIVVGESHSVGGDIVLCDNALHASRDPFDALTYAPGQYLYRVRCWGDVVEDDDKLGARYREYVDMRNATNTLRKFAREQALSVIHFWEAPPVVKEYLEAGDETLRAAACTASREAARAATHYENVMHAISRVCTGRLPATTHGRALLHINWIGLQRLQKRVVL